MRRQGARESQGDGTPSGLRLAEPVVSARTNGSPQGKGEDAMTKAQKAERSEAVARLREWLRPGDTVHTILRHVSRSGMQREVGVVILDARDVAGKEPTEIHPNWLVSKALGERQGKRDGIIMGGCGMDMGFALVYSLARTMFPDGFECIGDRCPSNDHSNGDRNRSPHHHADGGYALRQRWL